MVDRITLLSGCWAVRVVPELPEKKRSRAAAGTLAPNRSVAMRYHMRRAARGLAASSNRSRGGPKSNDRRGAKWAKPTPRRVHPPHEGGRGTTARRRFV